MTVMSSKTCQLARFLGAGDDDHRRADMLIRRTQQAFRIFCRPAADDSAGGVSGITGDVPGG